MTFEKKLVLIIAVAVTGFMSCKTSAPFDTYSGASSAAHPVGSVFFSPKGGCTRAVTGFIESSKSSVHMLAYSFTSDPIAQALIAAKISGRNVEVVFDRENDTDKYSKMPLLRSAGVSVWLDKRHAIAHEKIIVVDGGIRFETGSFNYTNQAESSNAENCLFINDHSLGIKYEENFQFHKAHSEPVQLLNPWIWSIAGSLRAYFPNFISWWIVRLETSRFLVRPSENTHNHHSVHSFLRSFHIIARDSIYSLSSSYKLILLL